MPGIMDLLGGLGEGQGGPDNPMSPEMIALLTELGKGKVAPGSKERILQPSGPNPYHATHWTQGAADMLNAISGQNMLNRADQARMGSRGRVPTVAGPTQPNAPPNSGRLPPRAPIDPNPAQTMFGVRPGDIPQGFSEAPNGQGATTNNDRTRMSLGAPPDVTNRRLPRSIRTNNPGAIEDGRFAQSNGAIGNDGRYATFATMEDGYRAQENLLTSYINRGFNTPEKIVGRWAPSNVDNNSTDAYTNHVARALGIRRDQPVPPERVGELAEAMASYEAGRPVPRQRQNDTGALPVVQAADRPAPQDNPPPARDMSNRPLGRAGLPIFNPEVDFRPTFPTPPPDDFGLTPQQSMDLDNLSERAYKRKIESLSRQWEPQYTDTVGGRRWIVPATGQTGFIPTPKYDHVEANGAKVPVVTIYDAHGRSYTYEQAPTGDVSQLPGTQTVAPTAPAAAPNAAPAPVTPPVAPNATAESTAPAVEPTAPVTPPAPIQNAPTLNNIPPLPNAPPAPPAARKSWLDGPTFARARDIQIEQSERKVSADTRQSAREEPIKQAIEVGNEAQRTRAILDQLRELENHPGIGRLITGPGAETILNVRTGINAALKAAGLPEWDPQMVAAGEQLRKLNTMLGSVGARQLTNRPTQFDFQAFLKANPGMLVSAQGRRFLTETLTQMAERDIAIGSAAAAYRGRAEDWPRILDRIYLEHRPVVNGNVLDSTVSNSRFDLNTGTLVFDRPVRGQIVGNPQGESFQYIGRTGNNQDGRNPALWVKVDPRKPETWRFPEMETPTRK